MRKYFLKFAKFATLVVGIFVASAATALADSPLYVKLFSPDFHEYPIFYSYEDCKNHSPYLVCKKFGDNPQCGIQLWSDVVPLGLARIALQSGQVIFVWYRSNSQQFCRIEP